MHAAPVAFFVLCLAGCAHHRNQYAYAPPLAPPVYPQPTVAPPTVQPPPPGVVAPAIAPGPVPVVTAAECCPPEGGVVGMPVVYEEGQTPPCPPAP